MRRREFITLLGGAATVWPVAARAQQDGRMRRIGILDGLSESDPRGKSFTAAFRQGLERLGWIEGRTLRIDHRFGPDPELMRSHAAELVNLAPELIVVSTGAAANAVEAQTRTIPIVFIAVGDVTTGGRVRNIARPEGNSTGFTNYFSSMGGKWVELLKEAIPSITRVALVNDAVNTYYPSIESAAAARAVRLTKTPVKDASEIEKLADTIASEPNGGLLIVPGVLGASHRDTILRLGQRHRLPTIFGDTFAAADGGLLAYGPLTIELFRRAPSYVDRILRGAKVADLPVQFPTKFELVVNLKTAKAIGVTIPESFLLRADEVIE